MPAIPNSRNLPELVRVTIRGLLGHPEEKSPEPEGFLYVARGIHAHLAICEPCRNFLRDKILEAAARIGAIGQGGV